jgi:opine dehydrogenase
METSLDNIGAVFHPAGLVLSAARVEAGQPFEFYRDMTPGVVRFMEAIDAERLAVADAFGVRAISACEWLARSYEGIQGDTLYERIQSNAAYHGIAPTRSTRATCSDVPTGLVWWAGALASVSMPAVEPGQRCCGLSVRFWQEGRNAERLGVAVGIARRKRWSGQVSLVEADACMTVGKEMRR